MSETTVFAEGIKQSDKDADKDAEGCAACLIGTTRCINAPLPSYFRPAQNKIFDKIEAVGSVDMVRLRLRFFPDGAEWIDAHAQVFAADDVSGWTAKVKPGGWRNMWTWTLGTSSVTCGLGLMGKSCRIDMHKGFLEFNPNKVAAAPRFAKLLGELKPWVASAELARWDLALDVPVARDSLRLSKDERNYEVIIGAGAMTEYLGRRNHSGRAKLYDKARELGAHGDLTRVELTCDGDWDAAEVLKRWPAVHGWLASCDGQAGRTMRVLEILLAEKVARGEEVETLVHMLDKRTRAKLREAMRTAFVELPEEMAVLLLNEARSWERLVV